MYGWFPLVQAGPELKGLKNFISMPDYKAFRRGVEEGEEETLDP